MDKIAVDYRYYHQREQYIYETVGKRFRDGHRIATHDLFCIIIWKANRAKSKEYHRLNRKKRRNEVTIDGVVTRLIQGLRAAQTPQQKLDLMLGSNYGFNLPMATAILSVFYPTEFTIYDWRVLKELKLKGISSKAKNANKRWARYEEYRKNVRQIIDREELKPATLRSADQWLWGKSFYDQLKGDLANGFPKKPKRENGVKS